MEEIQRKRPSVSMTRPQAIDRIRRCLVAGETDEQCACVVASRYGAFCGGFSKLSDKELRQRYHWIARKHPGISREELERLASLYHVGRQQATGSTICCDVETRDRCGCDGWNGYDSRTLESVCFDLTGEVIQIVDAPAVSADKRD
jgi:hypothetical protein